MMKLRNALVLVGLVSLFAAPAAMAGVGVSLVGVGSLGMPTSSGLLPVTGLSGSFGFGGGALFDLPLGQRLALELGGIYHTGKITADGTNFGLASGTTLSTSYNVIEVPVTLKIMLSHAVFLDLGGYAASFVGGPSASASDGSAVAFSGWGDFAQNTLNYGLMGGLGFNIAMGSSTALRVEGLYQLQLNNSYNSTVTSADSTSSFKYNAVEFRVGLSFGGGMSSR